MICNKRKITNVLAILDPSIIWRLVASKSAIHNSAVASVKTSGVNPIFIFLNIKKFSLHYINDKTSSDIHLNQYDCNQQIMC